MTKLSKPQQKLRNAAHALEPITHKDGSVSIVGILVSGHRYRTALALEGKGLGNVRYQGPSLGWYTNRVTV